MLAHTIITNANCTLPAHQKKHNQSSEPQAIQEAVQPQVTRAEIRGCGQQGQTLKQTARMCIRQAFFPGLECLCQNCGQKFMCLPR